MKIYFEEKLAENAARLKELRRTLKLLGLPNNKIPPSNIYLNNKKWFIIRLTFNSKYCQEIVLLTRGKSFCKTTKTIE